VCVCVCVCVRERERVCVSVYLENCWGLPRDEILQAVRFIIIIIILLNSLLPKCIFITTLPPQLLYAQITS
jgi:hypothetical protein